MARRIEGHRLGVPLLVRRNLKGGNEVCDRPSIACGYVVVTERTRKLPWRELPGEGVAGPRLVPQEVRLGKAYFLYTCWVTGRRHIASRPLYVHLPLVEHVLQVYICSHVAAVTA